MTTPRFILEAVARYMEDGDSRSLVEMFQNGIELWKYPESRDLVVSLLQGQKPRRKGGQKLTRAEKEDQLSCLIFVAQLHGAGIAVYHNGNATTPTACEIVGARHRVNPRHLYDRWRKRKDDDFIKEQIEFGRQHPELIKRMADICEE